MDSITHLTLGAVIGEAIGGRNLGKRAMALGAAAQFLPDFDFVAALWLSPAENLSAHRGITHSIAFALLSTIALAFVAGKAYKSKSSSVRFWLLFFGVQAGCHIFIDTFNAYGVGLLEPFDATRFSFHSLYVFDPLFLIWILIGAIVLISRKSMVPVRIWWASLSMGACAVYLAGALVMKALVHKEVTKVLKYEQISYEDLIVTPTPFNIFLWYVIVKIDGGYFTAYRSVFDESSWIDFSYFPRNDIIVKTTPLPAVKEKLVNLSQGYYTYSSKNDTVSISLIVFGQVSGWHDRNAPFVLECDLVPPETTLILLQKGREEEMKVESLSALVNRIFSDANRRPSK